MNKILKILSILVIGFVMFSCSTPTNDPTLYVPEPSGPETPVETPTEDPTEETPEEPTYSIAFITKTKTPNIFVKYLDTLPKFKSLKEGDEVVLLKHLYTNDDVSEITESIVEGKSAFKVSFEYYFNNSEIDSVVIGNENVKLEVTCEITDDLDDEDCDSNSLR